MWSYTGTAITDEDRVNALQRWLDSADLETGHVDFRIPGFLTGAVAISANVRQTVDAAIAYERSQGATP